MPLQARLESQLADLYHKLEQLQPNLCSLGLTSSGDSCSGGMSACSPPHDSRAGAPSSPPKDLLGAPCALSSTSLRCSMLLGNTLPLLRSCCYSLLSLSLLVPAAPWVGGGQCQCWWEAQDLSLSHTHAHTHMLLTFQELCPLSLLCKVKWTCHCQLQQKR